MFAFGWTRLNAGNEWFTAHQSKKFGGFAHLSRKPQISIKTTGTLGAAVALMVWFYWIAFAVLDGAELNAELAEISAQGRIEGKYEPPAITRIDLEERSKALSLRRRMTGSAEVRPPRADGPEVGFWELAFTAYNARSETIITGASFCRGARLEVGRVGRTAKWALGIA